MRPLQGALDGNEASITAIEGADIRNTSDTLPPLSGKTACGERRGVSLGPLILLRTMEQAGQATVIAFIFTIIIINSSSSITERLEEHMSKSLYSSVRD